MPTNNDILLSRVRKRLNGSSLYLNDYGIGDKTLTEIIVPFLHDHPEINDLELGCNYITDQGAKLLASIETVRWLNLAHNKIGNEGAKYLAANKNLERLTLNDNKIEDEGARAFLLNTTLDTLSLLDNYITPDVAMLLIDNGSIQHIFLNNLPWQLEYALIEPNPVTRANYGRAAKIQTEVPSLVRQSLFAIKNELHSSPQYTEDEKQQIREQIPSHLNRLSLKS